MEDRLLQQFRVWVQENGPRVSAASAHLYVLYVRQGLPFFGDVRRTTQMDIHAWRKEIRTHTTQGVKVESSASTINVKISAIRAFFQFLVAVGERRDDPTTELVMLKVPQRLPRPVDTSILDRVVQHIEETRTGIDRLQDLAMVEIAYGSGLRRAEIASITMKNILDRYSMRIIGKGDQERIVPLSDPAYVTIRALALDRYADERTETILEDRGEDAAFEDLRKRMPDRALFISPTGIPLPEMRNPGSLIYNKFRAWGEAIGLSETLNPHRLRHTYATELLNNGADILTIGASMGHRSIQTTQVYTKVQTKGIRKLREIHPRQMVEGG